MVTKTNLAYVELQTGMFYREAGQWKESREVIESFPGGAIARQGGHKVIFAEDFSSDVVVDMEMRDGQRLQSRVLGLSYVDLASGKSVSLAVATNSIGQIVNSNQVLYVGAFSGVKASVRFTYTKAGLEQDVILSERPATPESYGLDSRSTFLQVATEFLSPPSPVITSIKSGETNDGDEDQLLDFGAMQMVRGKAFATGLGTLADEVPVKKQWTVVDGRTILFEEVAVTRIADQLEALPEKKRTALFWNPQNKPTQQTAVLKWRPPARTAASSAPRAMRMAKLGVPVKGLVLDYVLLASSADFTFKGDQTYYVNATVVLTGTTTVEGGSVIKFLNNATTGISFNGPLVFKTDAYRPAVLTSKDDNSVGETISGSNNNPVKSTGNMYLVNGGASPNTSYRNLRIKYAGTGIQDPFMQDVWHCQLLECTLGVNRATGNILLRNVLFAQCTTAVKTPNAVDGQHLTVDACNRFADATVTSGTIINSILTAVTTLGNVTLDASSWQNPNNSGVYQIRGAGNYYLADYAHRNQGTTSIDATLAEDLKTRTTFAPDLLPDNFTVNTVLTRTTVERDNDDLPDRGYHYDPLDYCLTARTLGNATLELTGGVAVGVYGSTGIILLQGGNLVSQGSPTALNRLVRYNTVQEQKLVWGANTDPTSLMSVTTTPSTLSATLPTVTMRFTEMSLLANTATKRHILSTGGTNLVKTFSLQDCQVHGGYLYNQVYNNNPNQMTVTLLNNLLERTDFTFNQGYQGDTTPFLVTMRNNLALKSTLNLWTSTTASKTWHVHDNFFDTVALNGSGSSRLVHTHNGYRATTQISGTTSGNVTITTADYQTGPLGNYYYRTTLNGQNLARLIDVGSAAANVLGLCPYTVRNDQTPEGVSQVDIGFHYVALDSSGVPLDNNICLPPPCAIRSGFDSVSLEKNDDNHTGDGQSGDLIPDLLATLPFAFKYYGTTYSDLYVNNNGNVTFGSRLDVFTPEPLVGLGRDIIAPFWADVDTRDSSSDVVRYGNGTVGGRSAFGVNWVNVGYFRVRSEKLVSAQLILIERFDTGPGNFDMEFNYCKIQWEAGNASGGIDGFWIGPAGSPARAGFASASGATFEFNSSGLKGAFLDSTPSTGLIYNNFNSTEMGRYVFQFRSGIPQATP